MFNFDYVPPSSLGGNDNWKHLQDGYAQFIVTRVYLEDKNGVPLKTKSGHQKMNLLLKVRDSKGATGSFFDTISGNAAWKLKQLLDSVGMGNAYAESGKFDSKALEGAKGVLKMAKQDDGYGLRMQVKEFVCASEDAQQLEQQRQQMQQQRAQPQQPHPAFDDDIPF